VGAWLRRAAWVAVVGLLAAGVVTFVVRDAANGDAQDDVLLVFKGEREYKSALTNDDIPGEGDLRVCEWSSPDADGLRLSYSESSADFYVQPRKEMGPGEYAVGYTACRGDRRASATMTVTVLARPDVTVTFVRPGVLEVDNPSHYGLTFSYGNTNDEAPRDGRFVVPAERSRTFRVQRHDILWNAYRVDEPSLGFRKVLHGIELPPGVEPLPGFPGGIT